MPHLDILAAVTNILLHYGVISSIKIRLENKQISLSVFPQL